MKKLLPFWATLVLLCYFSTAQAQFSNNPAASNVLGQSDFVTAATGGASATRFNGPMGVTVDTTTGKVFVSDRYNNRVLRFSSVDAYTNGGTAEMVFGQTDFTTSTALATPTATSMNNPIGMFFDVAGRLWVADFSNNRILRFDNASSRSNGAAADQVLGQTTFGTKASGTTQSTLNQPVGIFYDNATGSLWVSDFGNHRVLKFANAAAKGNGGNADVVLGQTGFLTKTTGLTASTMNNPNGVYVDCYGNLWVSDRMNCRFLRFNSAETKTSGGSADGVLGQASFTTNTSVTNTASGSGNARFVWGDKNGRIYCMQENHRIMVFDNAASKANGANADGVMGQVDMTTATVPAAPTATNFKDPKAMFVNNANGDVWVTEQTFNRVLRFVPVPAGPLTVTSPNGSEQWAAGSVENINWTGNYTGTVKLEYSADLGASWNLIATAPTTSGSSSYAWTLPSVVSPNMLVRVSDNTVSANSDVSDASFLVSTKVIVVVGSSTAAGTGPSNIDSAWVWRYRRYVKSVMPNAIVINLAVGGYTTYECMPTGFVPPSGKAAPHTNANITKALSYHPSAILVNLPTNDAYWNYTITESLNNYATIAAEAANAHVPIWISTSQGRNLAQDGRDLLLATRDSILAIYQDHALDFWTGLSDADGYILSQYNSGDGVHMNSDAHKILCDRVIAAQIVEKALPVELTAFTAAARSGGILLQWRTATEVNNYGFDVERRSAQQGWERIGFVPGSGTTNSPNEYSFTDSREAEGVFHYRLKQIDRDGKIAYSREVEASVEIVPSGFAVSQNYPNPFNPSTMISYALPQPAMVSVKVFDLLGREVATLVNEYKQAGRYVVSFNGAQASSGIYLCKVQAGGSVAIKKMQLVK
jgi:lysophospholipase L1-like esterase/sugar lactone lactonase YvrE